MFRWVLSVLGVMGLLMMVGCESGQRLPKMIAHRGLSHEGPENTLAAVELAWARGADAVEVDVHLADGRVMVIHDGDTKRTGGEELVVAATDSGRLRGLDVGRFKGEQYAGERIPFVEEVIASVPKGRQLFIEVKSGADVLGALKGAIEGSGKAGQIVLIGFNLEAMAEAKAMMPGVPCYWLRGTVHDEASDTWLDHDPGWIGTARARGLDGLDVNYGGVTADFVAAARAAGQALYVWTVDDVAIAGRMSELGVTGVTTNRPAWLREQLGSNGMRKTPRLWNDG